MSSPPAYDAGQGSGDDRPLASGWLKQFDVRGSAPCRLRCDAVMSTTRAEQLQADVLGRHEGVHAVHEALGIV
jgi:hypothetical protein